MTINTAARTRHPSRRSPGRSSTAPAPAKLRIPEGVERAELEIGGRKVALTNLNKPFWPDLGITKRNLLQYYADIAPYLLPHIQDRAMVMKRYPDGAYGEFFFMKHAPPHRPDWLSICAIQHASANLVEFPVIDDLAALLWVVNMGCIDLNQWYARCDDVDKPDYLHFDLDPTKGAEYRHVLRAALIVRDVLETMGADCYVKTSGSKGMHLYVPIERGPNQKEVWTVAKWLARLLARQMPDLMTAEYRIAERPHPGGLQPERLGSHPGLRLFRAPNPMGQRLHSRNLAGSPRRVRNGGLSHRQRPRPSEEEGGPLEAAHRREAPVRA